jgi:hypothetical protein
LNEENYELDFDDEEKQILLKAMQRGTFEGVWDHRSLQTEEKVRLTEAKCQRMLQIAQSIIKVGVIFSGKIKLQSVMISSGMVWRALQFILFCMQRRVLDLFPDIDKAIVNCSLILLNLASSSEEIKKSSESIQDIDEGEKTILLDLNKSLTHLLPKKILEILIVQKSHVNPRIQQLRAKEENMNHA